jgi:chorismate mutase
MHSLLMERGRIIDSLIAIKAKQGGGSAFRPAREASMLRALVGRHKGHLPLDTVEGIWRVIISTFTYVQAPYCVHVDVSRGDSAIRDSARFNFGFTVPFVPHMSPKGVVDAVAASGGDLGLLAVDAGPNAGPWWLHLSDPSAPKVIARLPFVERTDHPAGMPVMVISKPLPDGTARDVVLESIRVDRWRDGYVQAIADLSCEVLGAAAHGSGLAMLVARPGALEPRDLAKALSVAGAADIRSSEIGAHAQRFTAPPQAASAK